MVVVGLVVVVVGFVVVVCVVVLVCVCVVVGVVVTVGQAIERTSGGWGISMGFFRVPFILSGPWYLTWLTSFVVLSLLFVYGMWFGLVYRRWNMLGLFAFVTAQVVVVVTGVVITSKAHAWPSIGHFFTSLTAAGLTGLLAALALALLAGGYTTARHVTV